MKAVIFQHMASNGPGTLKDVLVAEGFDCPIIYTSYEDISGFDALNPDVLVVMGGAPGVYQADDFHFLKHEQRTLEQRLAADKPTIGICLGAQLMAAALGARVYKGEQGPEIGWFDLHVNEAGTASPIKSFSNKPVMQWHGDTFDFPSGAKLLASSDKYNNQIFQYGRNSMGFQCHVEVTAPILADWYVQDAGMFMNDRKMLEKLRHDTAQHINSMTTATQRFMKDWLTQVLPAEERRHA